MTVLPRNTHFRCLCTGVATPTLTGGDASVHIPYCLRSRTGSEILVYYIFHSLAATTLHVSRGARSAVRTNGVDLRVDVMMEMSVAGCRRAAVSGKSLCCGERQELVLLLLLLLFL